MPLSKNTGYRTFTAAFLIGASLPLLASTTDQFKDLEITAANTHLSGPSAWFALSLSCGLCAGLLGLGIAALKARSTPRAKA